MRESDATFSPNDAQRTAVFRRYPERNLGGPVSAAQFPKRAFSCAYLRGVPLRPSALSRAHKTGVRGRERERERERGNCGEKRLYSPLERGRRRIVRLLPSDAWLGNSYNTTSLQEGFRYYAALSAT